MEGFYSWGVHYLRFHCIDLATLISVRPVATPLENKGLSKVTRKRPAQNLPD